MSHKKLLTILGKIADLEANHDEGDEHWNLRVHASVLFRNLIKESDEVELFPSMVMVNEVCGKTLISGEITVLVTDK